MSACLGLQRREGQTVRAQLAMGIELIRSVSAEPQMGIGMGLGAKLRNEQRDRRNDGNPKLNFSAQSFHGGRNSVVSGTK
jgi:hypothetical protein